MSPRLADFDNNEGYVVGEGTVAPGSYAVEDLCWFSLKWRVDVFR